MHCLTEDPSVILKAEAQGADSPSRAPGQESNRGPNLPQAVLFTTYLRHTPAARPHPKVTPHPVSYATPQSYVTPLVYIYELTTYVQYQQLRS